MEDGGRSLAGQFALRWTAPPGWDAPPDGFLPDLQWRPNRYWPEPPEDWEFWQIDADDEIVDLFHQPITGIPDDPEPVWVSPPGWPTPPAGWHPTTGWTPDRTWGPAPLGWQFWRQPPVDHRAKAAAMLSTRSGRLLQLNLLEGLFRSFAEQLAYATSDEAKQHVNRAPSVVSRHRNKQGFHRSHEAATEALMNARRGLLWAISEDRPADDATVEWQAVVLPRIKEAADWTYHVLMRRRDESPQDRRVRYLNSLPYGATSATLAPLESETSGEVAMLSGSVPWQQAERLAAMALQQYGFTDAMITGGSADAGIDVRASRIVAQVKYTSRPVGRPVIQQLIGASDGRAAAFFSLSGFTEQAREFADQRGVALFTVRLPTTVLPLNRAAEILAAPRRTDA